MSRERNRTALVACLLAFAVSFGVVGSMATGLKLQVTSLWLLGAGCLLASVWGSLCGRFRHGGWGILASALVVGWYFYRSEAASGQVLAMLHRMTTLYDHAYGWGVIPAGGEVLSDAPLMLVGFGAAMAVSWCVNRQKNLYGVCATALLPLGSCFVVTDTVPRAGYLFLVFWGLTVLLLTNSLRRKDLGQGLRLTGMASVAVAAALGLLFWAVPREGYDNHPENMQDSFLAWVQDMPAMVEDVGQRLQSRDTQTSQKESENLKTLGDRIERGYAVLDVTAPFNGTMYLRGQDYDVYDGESWTASRHRREDYPLNDYEAVFPGETLGSVTIKTRVKKDVLYLPYYTQPYTQLVGGRAENENGLKSYTYTQRVLPEGWQDAVTIPEVYDGSIDLLLGSGTPPEPDNYRVLPLKTREAAEQILGDLLADADSATEKADRIAAFVRNSAAYSLTPARMPAGEEDFALWFLRESDTGYCVHFATATAVLLRAAGVDARYVTGYVFQARAGQTVTVLAKQSHAWVEYFEPRLGLWIPLESTPADLTGGEAVASPQPDTQPHTEPDPTQTTAEETRPPETTAPAVPGNQETDAAVPNTPKKTISLPKWPLVLLILLLAVESQWRIRLYQRREKQRRGNRNGRALALWRELEVHDRLLKRQPDPSLEGLAQKAKYSQYILSREELAVLENAAAEGRNLLSRHAWYKKLVYRYLFAVS